MLGFLRDIVYDLDGSLAQYFFTSSQSSATLVNSFNHIAKYHTSECKSALGNSTAWNNLILCNSNLTIRRIMFTNAIGANNSYYSFYWINMFVYPVTSLTQTINSTDYSLITIAPPSYNNEKPYSWSLPFVTGNIYQVWWGEYNTITDYSHMSISTTPLYK